MKFCVIFAAVFISDRVSATSRQVAVKLSSRLPGTIKFGFLFPGHDTANDLGPAGSPSNCCGPVIVSQSLLVPQFRRIIYDINHAQPPILPYGVQLGYEILDTCASPNFASAQLVEWLKNRATTTDSPISLVIGSCYSRTSQTVAPFFEQFGIPMVDYGSTSPALSDRNAYGLFSRTTASDKYLAMAMVETLKHLQWPCVNLLHSRGQYGENGAEEVAQGLLNASICIANGGPKILPINESETDTFKRVVDNLSKNTRVIVCFCEDTTLRGLLRALIDAPKGETPKYFILAGDFWGTELNLNNLESVGSGSLTFKTVTQAGRSLSGRIGANNAALQEWIKQNLREAEFDPWLDECLIEKKGCSLRPISADSTLPQCNSTEFKETDLPTPDWLALLSNSIYAAAYGLRSFLLEKCDQNPTDVNCNKFDIRRDGYRLYQHILNATFVLENGRNFTFFNEREGYPFIEINRLRREHSSGKFMSIYEKFATWDYRDGFQMLATDVSLLRPTAAESARRCSTNDLCHVATVPDRIIKPANITLTYPGNGGVCVSPGGCSAIEIEIRNHQVTLPIIASILGVVILLLIVLVVVWYVKRKSLRKIPYQERRFMRKILRRHFSKDERMRYGKLFNNHLISSSELEIDTNQVLGRGLTGIVYKGKFGCEHVALKTLRNNTVDPQNLAQFIKEASVMLNFDHPNVLKLLGINISNDSLNLVFPYISGGNLKEFLRENRPRLSQDDRIFYCLQICSAMAYISSQNIIHRDLACRNVLVEKLPYMMLLKIADFGSSRQLAEDDYYVLDDGTANREAENPQPRQVPIRWYPPEALSYYPRPIFEVRSDVWSFGCVCVEIFSNGEKPYPGLTNNGVLTYVLHHQGFPDRPALCSPEFYCYEMMPCWRFTRSERPSFSKILQRLESYVDTATAPVGPPPNRYMLSPELAYEI